MVVASAAISVHCSGDSWTGQRGCRLSESGTGSLGVETRVVLKNNVFVTKSCHFRAYGVQFLRDQFVISEIKQGQACSGEGHGTMCVAGAECLSDSCTCKSTVYTADATTGKCSEYKVTHQIHAVQTSS